MLSLKLLPAIFISQITLYYAVRGDCPPSGANDKTIITDYVYINTDNYDRNYSSYNEDRRPLGYDKATVYFETGVPNPCIKVTNAANRMFEVMIETVPPSRICLKESKKAEKLCGNHHVRSCGTAPSGTVYVELLCSDCEETDVNMWYRIRMSDIGASGADIENWCSDEILEYPQELTPNVLPPGFKIPDTSDDKGNGAQGLNINLSFSMLLLILLYFTKCYHEY